MKIFAVIILLTFSVYAQSVTSTQIKELANKATYEGELIKELKILPKAGVYIISLEFTNVNNKKPFKVIGLPSKLKIGNENSIILSYPLPSKDIVYMMYTYDIKHKVYRKYFVMPNNVFYEFVGVATPNNKSIAWSRVDANGVLHIFQETYDPKSVEWNSISYKNGKIVGTEKGRASLKE